ncbi:unnamed protein product [Caenorhabditis angaria]|uniref:Uncharacterized protein n=1 Tax=Caenorhabditis angaria TaxID=860376 RepID=A0A9P1IKA0_9PELO|nr:unnamed protein product [Caenorhabditis angaria]
MVWISTDDANIEIVVVGALLLRYLHGHFTNIDAFISIFKQLLLQSLEGKEWDILAPKMEKEKDAFL